MSTNAPNFETILFLHVCENQGYFNKIDHDFFKDRYLASFFRLNKLFFRDYNEILFDLKTKDLDQTRDFASKNIDEIPINDEQTADQALNTFMNHCKNILAVDHRKFSEQYVSEATKSWIEWENSTKGFKLAMEYRASQKITPQNASEVIAKCRDIIANRSTIVWEDDESLDFFDPEAHKQIPLTDCLNTGYPFLNLWLCGDKNGGLEPGTLTLLVGEANIGKSIWLANLAFNMAVGGKNVMVVSLEMKGQKVIKRMGANAFSVDINDYSEFAEQEGSIEESLKDLKSRQLSTFTPMGALRVKKFSSATVSEIRAFVKKEEDRLGITFHAVVLDYFTELDNEHGTNYRDMYVYHKENANDLFKYASETDKVLLSAHQLKGNDYGGESDDITMLSLGESRGINHRADNIIAIIQPPWMKLDNYYMLKCLKPRDGAYKNWKIKYNINYSYMRLTETNEHLDPAQGDLTMANI